MLQMPPPLMESRPPCPLPWRNMGLNCGPTVISGVVGGGGGCIRPDRSSRTNVQKLTWRNSNWVRGYSESHVSSMTICDVSPTVAMKRIIVLYENKQYREAANFINRLHRATFKSILEDLPVDMFIDAMPDSLPILEALYAKVFLSDGLNFPMKILRPESVIMQIANMFSHRDLCDDSIVPNGPNPVLMSCKKLIKMIVLSEPRLKKQMVQRRRALEKAVEGMGQHGLVGTSDKKTLMNLHEALKLEFERIIHLYKVALQKLDELCLTPKQLVTRSLSYGPAPIKASHQRQLSLRQDEIQERLIKNKTLLNVIEPTLTDNSLDVLLKILRKRVEIDKDIVFQFTQLKKEVKDVDPNSLVAPILMKFSKGCSKVVEIMKELGDDGDDDISSSDISGYHSDSDSAVASGSFQSRGCRRYNLMYRSVRLHSRSSSGASSTGASSAGASSAGASSAGANSPGSSFAVIRYNESSRPNYSRTIGADNRYAESAGGSYARASGTDTRSRHAENGGANYARASSADPAANYTRASSAEPGANYARAICTGTNSADESVRPKSRAKYGGSKTLVPVNEPGSTTVSIHVPDARNYTTLDSSQRSRSSSGSFRARVVYDDRERFIHHQELEKLRRELHAAQLTIEALQERETKLKCRLAEQAQKIFERGIRFENISSGRRQVELIQSFADLFGQTRVDTIDALDQLEPLRYAHMLKSKIMFSVVVLAFRSVQNHLCDIKMRLRPLFHIGDPTAEDPAYDDLEKDVLTYLRRTADSYDLSRNESDVAAQIYATLYDYPCLKNHPALMHYIHECVHTAWCLTIQNPPFVIEYDQRDYDDAIHSRFPTSDHTSNEVQSYLWPELHEGLNGRCVHKGVVLT